MNHTEKHQEIEAPCVRAAAPVFSRRKGQTQLNLDILNYLAAHQPCKFEDLYALFGSLDGPGAGLNGFKDRLRYLESTKQLQYCGKGTPSANWLFSLDEMAGKMGVEIDADYQPKPKTRPPQHVGAKVPSRQHSPSGAYRPAPLQALRPGSDEFTRLPSLRQGQRLPFTGGYVAVAGSKS